MGFDLDAPCGLRLRFRDLVECGTTFGRHAQRYSAGLESLPLVNVPEEPATWEALGAIATTIIDPVEARFGPVRLTYGFSGPALVRAIRRLARREGRGPRICPELDQHAGYERVNGGRVCERDGVAIDFDVVGVPTGAVAGWLLETAPVDRLYLYGDGRPLHVSWAPRPARLAYRMRQLPTGRWVPSPWTTDGPA